MEIMLIIGAVVALGTVGTFLLKKRNQNKIAVKRDTPVNNDVGHKHSPPNENMDFSEEALPAAEIDIPSQSKTDVEPVHTTAVIEDSEVAPLGTKELETNPCAAQQKCNPELENTINEHFGKLVQQYGAKHALSFQRLFSEKNQIPAADVHPLKLTFVEEVCDDDTFDISIENTTLQFLQYQGKNDSKPWIILGFTFDGNADNFLLNISKTVENGFYQRIWHMNNTTEVIRDFNGLRILCREEGSDIWYDEAPFLGKLAMQGIDPNYGGNCYYHEKTHFNPNFDFQMVPLFHGDISTYLCVLLGTGRCENIETLLQRGRYEAFKDPYIQDFAQLYEALVCTDTAIGELLFNDLKPLIQSVPSLSDSALQTFLSQTPDLPPVGLEKRNGYLCFNRKKLKRNHYEFIKSIAIMLNVSPYDLLQKLTTRKTDASEVSELISEDESVISILNLRPLERALSPQLLPPTLQFPEWMQSITASFSEYSGTLDFSACSPYSLSLNVKSGTPKVILAGINWPGLQRSTFKGTFHLVLSELQKKQLAKKRWKHKLEVVPTSVTEMHDFVTSANWDDAGTMPILTWMAKNESLDKGTALHIFWHCYPGDYYAGISSVNDIKNKRNEKEYHLCETLAENVRADFYESNSIPYTVSIEDASESYGYDAATAKRKIPDFMFRSP